MSITDKALPTGWGRHSAHRGSALLAVLWISAALAVIAFSLSTTVRGETERVETTVDSLRSYYLASGAIERAAVELLWSVQNPGKRPIPARSTAIDYTFPSGMAHVEIVPETAKLNVNRAPVEQLYRLMAARGVEEERARVIALSIDEARRPGGGGGDPFAAGGLLQPSSFRTARR